MGNEEAEFRKCAATYCDLIENAGVLGREVLLAHLHELLPALICVALRLPEVETSEGDSPEIDQESWAAQYRRLAGALGAEGAYWTTLATLGDALPQPVMLPLADDLADIWRDLKAPLIALDGETSLSDAAWEWRFSFHSHWGSHAVEALRAVHAMTR
ncbi:DUF5063 domain-containing protein [Nocardioides panacisoli]|uniref:DUF5063 domain-containing protein n=1 Tax=Nocardioides panacisoli TaxID=627624 RepID=UPI001C634AF0|nr:DUF5063 domain-containing protein [Nocardioides panacisoli]QYJ04097.1 DUF5063 domain-containing protein [Nocardioides panacisoli]